MRNCRNIRWELSAYLDGELTPPQRTEVEAHLASCTHCQQALLEMKTLVSGVGALPKLQPAPRFLAEVRRKIARAEKPEALTWRDHVFRPFWLKVPLEVAALIVIVGLVISGELRLSTQKIAPLKLAKAENRENEHGNTVLSETRARPATAKESKSAVAAQAPAMGTPGLAIDDDKKQLLDKSAASEMVAGGADNQPAVGPRRIPVVRNDDELSTTPPSAPSPVVDLIRSIEFPRSKPSEIVTVHARVFDEVRNQAQQLAARCSGRVVIVPQSKDATEQTFFVALPQEYVAAFKLELLKTSGSSTALARGGIAGESVTASAVAASTGVLTGNAPTNSSADGLATFGLKDDATAAAPATLLEIRVVAPAN
jgi:hypothetical protein